MQNKTRNNSVTCTTEEVEKKMNGGGGRGFLSQCGQGESLRGGDIKGEPEGSTGGATVHQARQEWVQRWETLAHLRNRKKAGGARLKGRLVGGETSPPSHAGPGRPGPRSLGFILNTTGSCGVL